MERLLLCAIWFFGFTIIATDLDCSKSSDIVLVDAILRVDIEEM
jgi:hypothetical protein